MDTPGYVSPYFDRSQAGEQSDAKKHRAWLLNNKSLIAITGDSCSPSETTCILGDIMEKFDLVIIGAGAAGMSAGIYGSRAGLDTLVLERQMAGGLTSTSPLIENYLGFEGLPGGELTMKMAQHAKKFVEIREIEDVQGVERKGDSKDESKDSRNFIIKTDDEEYPAKAVILATGADHRKLGVSGEEEYAGRGVSYCATCDGPFFKGMEVLVVGGGNTALVEALYLQGIGCSVHVIHRRDSFRAGDAVVEQARESGVDFIMDSVVKGIRGDDNVVNGVNIQNIKTGEESRIDIEGIFIAVGIIPNNALAKSLGVQIDGSGFIAVDRSMRTSVERVYAAGDLAGGVRQTIVAAAEGAIAALSAHEDIVNPYYASV